MAAKVPLNNTAKGKKQIVGIKNKVKAMKASGVKTTKMVSNTTAKVPTIKDVASKIKAGIGTNFDALNSAGNTNLTAIKANIEKMKTDMENKMKNATNSISLSGSKTSSYKSTKKKTGV
jgi:hypothetical protein